MILLLTNLSETTTFLDDYHIYMYVCIGTTRPTFTRFIFSDQRFTCPSILVILISVGQIHMLFANMLSGQLYGGHKKIVLILDASNKNVHPLHFCL